MSINPGSKSLKKNFTLQEKYDIIRYHEQDGTRVKELQTKFGCGKTQIYRMIKQRDEIKQEYLSGTKNPKTKRSVKYTPNNEINNQVLKWYHDAKERGEIVSGVAIKAKALEIGEASGLSDFKASNGWLQSFQYRNNISLSGNKKSRLSSSRNSSSSPTQPTNDPLQTDSDDIFTMLDETPVDSKNFHKLHNAILNVKSLDCSDSTDLCTICDTVLYYNTLPDDVPGLCTDQLAILFCYYTDGEYEKPLITLNKSNSKIIRKQFFNDFIVKTNTTGLISFSYIVEYLTVLNNKLEVDNRHITVRLDKKFEKFTFGAYTNIELVFTALDNDCTIVTDFKLHYRNLLLNLYIPFACTKKLIFSKHFDLNDTIKLILKSIGNMNFSTSNGGSDASDLRAELYDKLVICKFFNLNTDHYLNIDMVQSDYNDGWMNDEPGDSDDENSIISLSKATIYLIEIKKMLMKRGGDERLIDKVDELQSDLNVMCFEEKRLDLI